MTTPTHSHKAWTDKGGHVIPVDCIAVPTTIQENGDLAILFACWNLLHGKQHVSERLLITYPGEPDESITRNVDILIRIFGIDSMFNKIDVVFLRIPEDEDIYIRDARNWSGAIPRLGLKNGPNVQFFKTLSCARGSRFSFVNETDVFPIVPSWLANLSSDLRPGHDWVLGSHYLGETNLGIDIVSHINGAAVYATGSKGFQEFCEFHWEPGLEEMCKRLPDTAYDIWLSRMQHMFSVDHSLWDKLPTLSKKAFRDAISRFSTTDQIANLSLPSDNEQINNLVENGVSLVHGKQFRSRALANALHYASSNHQHTLTALQALSIRARAIGNREIHAVLDLITTPIRAQKSSPNENRGEPQSPKPSTLDVNPPRQKQYTALAVQDESISAKISLLAKETPSTLIAFSPYKAGSTLLFTGLALLQSPDFLNMEYVSYYDQHFQRSGRTDDNSIISYLHAKDNKGNLFENGKIYGGFRDCIPFTSEPTECKHIDIFRTLATSGISAHFVFLLRDPRDCLTSLYYSHKKSHSITSKTSHLVAARKDAEAVDVDTYVQLNMIDVKENMSRMLALINACNHHGMPVSAFAYEDIYFRQRHMFSSIANTVGKPLTKKMWDEMVRRSKEVSDTPLARRPSKEDSSSHIRKGLPGDHKEKLTDTTINACTKLFSAELSLLQDINPGYTY